MNDSMMPAQIIMMAMPPASVSRMRTDSATTGAGTCGGTLRDQILNPCNQAFDLPLWLHTSSGNSNNGTVRNGAGWSTGQVGGALQLDGANAGVAPKLALIRELFNPATAKGQRPTATLPAVNTPPAAAASTPTPMTYSTPSARS